jgi:flagellar L-ring protein precursor FlgH
VKAAPALLAAICVLAGCGLAPPSTIVQQPLTARPVPSSQTLAPNGAIYQARGSYRPLFEDVRARNVGDTLVVLISESTTANKKGSAKVDRSADVAAEVTALNRVPGKSLLGLNVAGNSTNSFDGSGESANSNAFTGSIAVTVTEVLPNGNLQVSGEKQVALAHGTEYIRFSGVVNPRTIVAANTVSSAQVADARIEYKANGFIDSATVMGWLGRFFLTFLPF